MTRVPINPQHRNELLRFLHTGTELPIYYPGCWKAHKYFTLEKLVALDVILRASPNCVEVVEIIKKAGEDDLYSRFITIAFALVKCLLLGNCEVKNAVYTAASQLCNTPEKLMLFSKYCRLLKTGNGTGWRRCIKSYYMTNDPMVLAKEMTRVRSRFGRNHKVLLRKAHIKLRDDDFARQAIISYAIIGFKNAKQLLGGKEDAKSIFDYIQKVEDLRHCESDSAAALMAAENNFGLDHIPGHLLTSQEVWNSILPQFNISDLLSYIIRIHNMGFLGVKSPTTAIILSMLTNKSIVEKSKVTPIEAYIAYCSYKNLKKPMSFEKIKVMAEKEARRRTRQTFNSKTGQWEWTTTKRHPKEAKTWGIDQPANPAIVSALIKLVDMTWLLTPPTNVRYLITMDMRNNMFKGRHFCKNLIVSKRKKIVVQPKPSNGEGETEPKTSKKRIYAECFYNKCVIPGHAAIVTALHILKREKDVTLAVFNDEGIEIVYIERNFSTIDEAEFVLRKANLGRVQLDAPILWAMEKNRKFDVFINMVDRVSRYMELERKHRGGRGPGGRFGEPPSEAYIDHCPVRALNRYKQAVGIENAKLIVMNLATHRAGISNGSHEGVLDIVGIDKHVPKVMDAFALGQFQ